MNNIIYLKENAIYFHAGFLDKELSIPIIETWIYKGIDLEDGYLFQDASDETCQYCFPNKEIENVFDRETLSEWLLENHSPKKVRKEYEYRTL